MTFGEKETTMAKRIALFAAVALLLFFAASPRDMNAHKVEERERETKVMILNYHKVDNMNISLSVLPKDFDAQMKYLKENGYHTITPDELYGSLMGTCELPEKPVLITFDDGYADNYHYAYPILRKYDFKATIFLASGFMGKYDNYVTWDQVREMASNGISIQSHSVTHSSMSDLSDEQLQAELTESKEKIEAEIGQPVQYFAYPTGTYDFHIAHLVREAGYKAAFTIRFGNVDEASNLYALERIPIFHTEDTFSSFLERIHYVPAFEQLSWRKG